ncbi:hypothetical protein PAECIP112173_04180 [Paenibacillus sp. JJ-100]|uniref:hypothetical protein n=1 Tax=Paenibacillus sp. JJ-100 TaxID=2974896 RepID=UPI0022FF7248|nr:hypothetical protein [Paenibacillus sp. JJ-100]CAI6084104.1 hypothetical protein PAECIP112173_04180 [Paenibacillus sp. JJ-100]
MNRYGDEMLLKMDRDFRLAKRIQEIEASSEDMMTQEEVTSGLRRGLIETDEESITLNSHQIWEGVLTLPLPDHLVQVPRGKLQEGRNSHGRDEVMWIDERKGISICLSRLSHPLHVSQIERMGVVITEQMGSLKKEAQWLHEEKVQGDSLVVFYGESIQPSTRGMAYDMVFVTSVGGRAVTGNVRFPVELLHLWRLLTRAIFICAHTSEKGNEPLEL